MFADLKVCTPNEMSLRTKLGEVNQVMADPGFDLT